MPYPRYLRCVEDVPTYGLRAGDLVEIDPRADHPIISIRTHGANMGAFLGLEADGALISLDAVVGLPTRASTPSAPARPARVLPFPRQGA